MHHTYGGHRLKSEKLRNTQKNKFPIFAENKTQGSKIVFVSLCPSSGLHGEPCPGSHTTFLLSSQ